MEENQFKYSNAVIAVPLFFVLSLWFVYWLQIRFDFDFVENGILPRNFFGLQGLLFSPFIHSSLEHLYHNSMPLLVLLAALFYFYVKEALGILVYGILLSGLMTWIIGRENYHIGASGLIYVLVSFVFFKGLQTRYYRLVALSFAVLLLYGGMLWYVFPDIDQSISWEGHLSGFITGFLLSLFYRKPEFQKVYKYDWERPDYDPSQDKFMQCFDEKGNFVKTATDIEEVKQMQAVPYFCSSTPVIYEYIASKPGTIEDNGCK